MQTSTTEARGQPGRIRLRQGRYRVLSDLDLRTRAGRRARDLMHEFAGQLGGELPSAVEMQVSRAACLVAIAEDRRMRMLAGEGGTTLDDLVRIDRLANLAVKQLGLLKLAKPAPSQPSALDALLSRGGEHEG